MKATEFCGFFDFSIEKGDFIVPADTLIFYEGTYKYRIMDDEACFSNRYINNISEVTECFDSMLPDYVEDVLVAYGFVCSDPDFQRDAYYKQALNWIESSCPELVGTDTHQVIECLVSPKRIIDNL